MKLTLGEYVVVAVLGTIGATTMISKMIPKNSFKNTSLPLISLSTQIKPGTINPNDLTFRFNSPDNSGTNSLQATYNGTNYLLTLDKEGRPQFQQYRVETTSAVPAQSRLILEERTQ